MKRTIFTIAMLLASIPLQAGMIDYCSAPPYVTRSVAPNIMVLMDNSGDMRNPAFPGAYSPDAEMDNYYGYFKPTGCYSYSSSKFQEQLVTSATPNRSYTKDETCPATAPFRGNLMNWATMSKYDVLQKVLIGGNSASKQGNAHTLVSIGGAWPDKIFNSCIFRVNNGNLVITESIAEACSLLNSPAVPIAMQPAAPVSARLLEMVAGVLPESAPFGLGTNVRALWDDFELVPSAWAAPLCGSTSTGSLNATSGEEYVLTLNTSCSNCTFDWSGISVPAWLSGPSYSNTNNNKAINGSISWSGTPPASGSFPFTATATSAGCDPDLNFSGNVAVAAGPLKINTTAFPAGTFGVPYYFELNGQGGTPPVTWTASPLPAGLSVGSSTVTADGESVTTWFVSGTPTTAGTTLVNLALTGAAGGTTTRTNMPFVINGSNLQIVSGSLNAGSYYLPAATYNIPYSYSLVGDGGIPAYSWFQVSGTLPPGLSLNAAGQISGNPTSNCGSSCGYIYTFSVRLIDSTGYSTDRSFSLVSWGERTTLSIMDGYPNYVLPSAIAGKAYSYKFTGDGGTEPYTWAATSTLPAGMSLSAGGILTWTPTRAQINDVATPYSVTIRLTDSAGTPVQVSRTFTIHVVDNNTLRSQSFNVKVDLAEEPLADLNGNGIWDAGETYTDSNGNGVWDGKGGVFQKFWDVNRPKARWGLTSFQNGGTTSVSLDSCIPAAPASSFYTTIQNATAAATSPLATGLYGDLNFFGFNSPYGSSSGTRYQGCGSSDPIDNVPCRKNFVLMITSGADVSGTAFSSTTDCAFSDPLVQNACYGQKTDLRPTADKPGKQNVYTYVVNTMGTANNSILEEAARKGGGKYYEAGSSASLEDQLVSALEDILSQAASGTAVSVLTTSSRGIGSMMQAYFLPNKQDGDREVRWTGYVQNLWIDPYDNLREDTLSPYKLKLEEDRVLRLYFDETTNETKAALFDEPALAGCENPEIKNFSDIKYTWEGGKKLALRDPSDRDVFTSTKVIRGATTTHTFAATAPTGDLLYPEFTTSMAGGLLGALNADATYTTDNIVKYVRGECLETGVSGDTSCNPTPVANFRDRRINIPVADSGAANGNVWKLGDVISSTPKVLSGTANNTYHIDYGDITYYNYVTENAYKQRSSISFVGANDGMLHAFRVGYLQDKDLESGVLGWFKNFIDDDGSDQIGEEVWGYIPFNAFPYLKYMANPDYCHIYFNDLSVRLVDASIGGDPAAGRATNSWRTILIGGMRFGGACDGGIPSPPIGNVGYSAYYAIDVTDVERPVPLWEFSDADMGYATTFPSIVRTGDKDANGNWYAVVGSGSTTMPKSGANSMDVNRTSPGYIYFLDLETGEMVQKIALDHNAIVGDVLAIDKEKDYSSEKLFFGTSYLDAGTWKGKLVSLAVPNQALNSWTPAAFNYLFSGNYPITASPDAAADAYGNVWVYAGSGKYFSDNDEDTIGDQIFVGIKDSFTNLTTTDLSNRTGVVTEGTVSGTASVCAYDADSGTFGFETVVTSTTQTSELQTVPPKGWYVLLSEGERVISRPLAVGGLVDFLTYKPSSDACSYGGNSYLYALDYTKGVAPASVAIRTSETTGGDIDGPVTISSKILLGPGAPPAGEAIIVPPAKEGSEQLKKKIQVATGVIVEAENTPILSVSSKIVHWLKK
jgi:type IV pilus assembly protein PilY1